VPRKVTMEDFIIPEFRGKDPEDYEEDSAANRSHLTSPHNLKANGVPFARILGFTQSGPDLGKLRIVLNDHRDLAPDAKQGICRNARFGTSSTALQWISSYSVHRRPLYVDSTLWTGLDNTDYPVTDLRIL